MSRSYQVLAAAIVVVLAALGVARLVSGDGSGASAGPTTVAPTPAPTSIAPAPAPTSVAPSTAAPTSAAATTTMPATTLPATTLAPLAEGCSAAGTSAAIDRDAQRAWLCEDGRVTLEFPITSAWTLPDPGTFAVYDKDMNASSTFGGHYSTMTHFVAFTYGENTGARVAFHSVPTLTSGEFVQPLDSVGDLGRRGESSGCIRVLPDDAVRIWDALAIGDQVTVLT